MLFHEGAAQRDASLIEVDKLDHGGSGVENGESCIQFGRHPLRRRDSPDRARAGAVRGRLPGRIKMRLDIVEGALY